MNLYMVCAFDGLHSEKLKIEGKWMIKEEGQKESKCMMWHVDKLAKRYGKDSKPKCM